ncbi:MAG: hypothetical protein AB2A00_24895 [Myxococcota bacterium]
MEYDDFEQGECEDCRQTVTPPQDPVYRLGEDAFLCLQCATRRGGVYNADEDRWVVEPSLRGIEGLANPPPP